MKVISVPVNSDAQARLDFDQAVDGDLVELNLEQDEFDALWSTGVIRELNDKIGVLIDDFESESITGIDKLEAALLVVSSIASSNMSPVLEKLEELIKMAIKFDTGIYFYF